MEILGGKLCLNGKKSIAMFDCWRGTSIHHIKAKSMLTIFFSSGLDGFAGIWLVLQCFLDVSMKWLQVVAHISR